MAFQYIMPTVAPQQVSYTPAVQPQASDTADKWSKLADAVSELEFDKETNGSENRTSFTQGLLGLLGAPLALGGALGGAIGGLMPGGAPAQPVPMVPMGGEASGLIAGGAAAPYMPLFAPGGEYSGLIAGGAAVPQMPAVPMGGEASGLIAGGAPAPFIPATAMGGESSGLIAGGAPAQGAFSGLLDQVPAGGGLPGQEVAGESEQADSFWRSLFDTILGGLL